MSSYSGLGKFSATMDQNERDYTWTASKAIHRDL